ncbi:MAG: hypothetical protein J6Q13_00845 [Clostridia bacterium]|nr:hypothetical protein [Clostridia bacterium]
MINYIPKLLGKNGNKFFMFNDGTYSKLFYSAGEFDFYSCEFPILDESGKVVEYMDIIGNFSKDKTIFARKIYDYVTYEFFKPTIVRTPGFYGFYFALECFPAGYLTDERIKKFVIKEEKRKYEYLVNMKQFASLFERLGYKIFMKQILKKKLNKAKELTGIILTEEDIQTI